MMSKIRNSLGLGMVLSLTAGGAWAEQTINEDLKIIDVTPTITLEDDTSGDADWFINADQFGNEAFTIELNDTAPLAENVPFTIENLAPTDAFYMQSDGDIGLGIATPEASLEVQRSDGTAKIRVEETSAVDEKRTMYNLVNNGQIRFTMEDISTSRVWDFLLADDGFNVSLVGTGGAEMVLRDNGGLRVGPGGAASLLLTSGGNLFIAGTLTESSSRETKTDFEAVEDAWVLERLARLPISVWRYKHMPETDRHMGPMAEDFYAAFGLGPDDKHISPKDIAAVSMVAAKALNDRVRSLDDQVQQREARIAELEAYNGELMRRLEDLESTVHRLAAGMQSATVASNAP